MTISPVRHLTLVSRRPTTAAERSLLKVANWMGVPTTAVAPEEALGDAAVAGDRRSMAMSAETLASIHRTSAPALRRLVENVCDHLIVFGCDGAPSRIGAVSWLTGGAVGVVSPAPIRPVVDFPSASRPLTHQLAGSSFVPLGAVATSTFDEPGSGAVEPLMRLGGKPALLRTRVGGCQVFLLASSPLPDLDAPCPADQVETRQGQIIPVLVFLRHAFGPSTWHGVSSTAHLIIDDPLLTERYGFLDYRALLASMRRLGYGTSVAFIPWNFRRTSPETVARLFRDRADFHVCIHGCDHTAGEFDGDDRAALEAKARLSIRRMERHRARTGLPFAPVMVFPQGRFSETALRALRAADFLAAVNSSPHPSGEGTALTLSDLLRPAVTRFHGFPLFARRYPRRLFDSALDLFLGKPALLVAHHHDFRDGGASLEEFLAGLGRLEPSLAWPSLSSQLAQSCLVRDAGGGLVDVLFFARRFRVTNTGAEPRRYRLRKHEPLHGAVAAVRAGEASATIDSARELVEVELELDPGEARDVEILDHPSPTREGSRRRDGLLYQVRVLGRRGLSEFRDNTLVRHPRLLRAATGLAKGLHVVGHGHGRP